MLASWQAPSGCGHSEATLPVAALWPYVHCLAVPGSGLGGCETLVLMLDMHAVSLSMVYMIAKNEQMCNIVIGALTRIAPMRSR